MIESAVQTEEKPMPLPKWQVLAQAIRDRIKSGTYAPGDRLPTTKELCAEFGVSAIVVRNAMISLKAEGLVEGVPGVGVYVAERTT
jgi:GntR family transcriptional regulator